MMDIAEKFQKLGVVPVVVLEDTKDAVPLAKALVEGGLPCAEVTFRTEAAEESICLMTEQFPEMLVGAGTVLTREQVDAAVVDDAKHALGTRGPNRMVKRGGQVFEDDTDAVDDRRGHMCRSSAAQGSEYDQKHEACNAQQASDTMGDGVHNLLAHRVLRNGRGLRSRLGTVARIGHAGYILQRK